MVELLAWVTFGANVVSLVFLALAWRNLTRAERAARAAERTGREALMSIYQAQRNLAHALERLTELAGAELEEHDPDAGRLPEWIRSWERDQS